MDMYSKKKKLRYCECSREMHHLTLPEKRKYTISSRNPRSVMPTMVKFRKKLRKLFCLDDVRSLSVPLMDWWTATFPRTIELLPVHIIPVHADHLIDTWMETWYCKEKENIIPLIGKFGRTDLLQSGRFQVWYPGTECAARIALEAASNEHDSDSDSDRDPGRDANIPSYPGASERRALVRLTRDLKRYSKNRTTYFVALRRHSHHQHCRAMHDSIATRTYIRGIFLAVENDHESTAQMILDLFEKKFSKEVFEKSVYWIRGGNRHMNKRISEKVAAWIRKNQPIWDQQKHLEEGVSTNPKKKKQKLSDS
jgi:hypothetical protein